MHGLTMKETIGDELLDDNPTACATCLRRSHLVTILSPFIEELLRDGSSWDVRKLLALDDEQLIEAVVPTGNDRVTNTMGDCSAAKAKSAMVEAEVWGTCLHDGHYPKQLAELGHDAPPVLYGTGDSSRLSWLTKDSVVSVVGARRATSYGLECGRTIGHELAAQGLTVVSGLALGIDASVHRGALESGRTVAVLAGGPDSPYPVSNRSLYRKIIEDGLILSEMPPTAKPMRWAFPARNRIIAALAGATVVVEAAARSGSLITARLAAEIGREVGAVPGPVTSAGSAGSNELIRNGATLIRDGRDAAQLI